MCCIFWPVLTLVGFLRSRGACVSVNWKTCALVREAPEPRMETYHSCDKRICKCRVTDKRQKAKKQKNHVSCRILRTTCPRHPRCRSYCCALHLPRTSTRNHLLVRVLAPATAVGAGECFCLCCFVDTCRRNRALCHFASLSRPLDS